MSNKYGQVFEGEIEAYTEEEAFGVLSLKDFMVTGVFKIDLSIKTESEKRVDRRLRQLESYRDRMEGRGPSSSPKVYAQTQTQTRRRHRARWLWWVLIFLVFVMAILKLLGETPF